MNIYCIRLDVLDLIPIISTINFYQLIYKNREHVQQEFEFRLNESLNLSLIGSRWGNLTTWEPYTHSRPTDYWFESGHWSLYFSFLVLNLTDQPRHQP